MPEMTALSFYENVFELTKNVDLNYFVEKVIFEIDETVRKWNANSEQRVVPYVENQRHDFCRVKSRDLCQIVEIFRNRTAERDMYMRIFPEYQINANAICIALLEEAEKLCATEKFKKPKTYFSAIVGGLGGTLRIVSIFNPLSAVLSTIMNASSVINGTFQGIYFGVEHIAIEKHLRNFEKLMIQYKVLFEKTVYHWFIYDDLLQESVRTAVGSKTAKKIFNVLKEIHENNANREIPVLEKIKNLAEVLTSQGYPVHVAYPIAAGLFQIFWIHYGRRWISDWKEAALPFERMKTLFVVGSSSAHAALAYESLQNPSNSFYSSSVASAFAAVVDFVPILSDLYLESETRKKAVTIRNKAIEIKQELDRFNMLYEDLKAEKDSGKITKRIIDKLNDFYENLKAILLLIFYIVFILLATVFLICVHF